jgi:hypothetical protein
MATGMGRPCLRKAEMMEWQCDTVNPRCCEYLQVL